MVSIFDTAFDGAAEALYGIGGEAMTYAPPGGGAAVSFTGILHETKAEREEYAGGETDMTAGRLLAKASELTAPAVGGIVTVTSTGLKYAIAEPPFREGGQWEIPLTRKELKERTAGVTDRK